MKLSQSNIDFLLANQISLKDRNIMLFTQLQSLIEQKNFGDLKGLMIQMNNTPEIHVSLLKCVELMTEHVPEVQEIRQKTKEICELKIVS